MTIEELIEKVRTNNGSIWISFQHHDELLRLLQMFDYRGIGYGRLNRPATELMEISQDVPEFNNFYPYVVVGLDSNGEVKLYQGRSISYVPEVILCHEIEGVTIKVDSDEIINLLLNS